MFYSNSQKADCVRRDKKTNLIEALYQKDALVFFCVYLKGGKCQKLLNLVTFQRDLQC